MGSLGNRGTIIGGPYKFHVVGAESTVGPNDNESDNDFLERIHCMPRTKEELVNHCGIVAMSSVLPYIN